MDLRLYLDRIAAAVGAVFLLLCAVFIWRSAGDFQERVAAPVIGPGKAKPVAAGAGLSLSDAVKQLQQPPQWTTGGRSGLFVPAKHFIGPDGLPVTLSTTEVHPPVPNEWLEKFNLPLAEGDVLSQDPDGDGFDNLEEWKGQTHPTEKESHPPYLTKLKLLSVSTEPLPVVFSSSAGGSYAINFIDAARPIAPDGNARIDRTQPTQFVREGETIRGTGLRVRRYTEKSVPDKYGTETDVSELLLENTATGEQITLVKEKAGTSRSSVGTFVYSWGGRREMRLKKEAEFLLPPATEIRYKLVDVQPGRAVIVNLQKPEERIEIGLLAP